MIRNIKPKNSKRKKEKIYTSPPQYESTITVGIKIRFIASAILTNVAVFTTAIMRLLVMAVTTTTTFSIIDAFKIRRVWMWAASSATLPVTISLEYAGAGTATIAKPKNFTDTSIGQTRNAIIKSKPDKQSSAAMWQGNNQGTITTGAGFVLSGPAGTVLDLELTITLQNKEGVASPPTPGRTITGPAVVGTLYCDTLDNQGTGLLVPQGYIQLPA